MEEIKTSDFSVIRASLPVLLVNVVGLPLVLLLQIVLAKTLGTAQYGVYEAVLGVVAILTLFSSYGVDWYLLREVPKSQSPQKVLMLARWGAQLAVNGALFGSIILGVAALGAAISSYRIYALSLVAAIPLLLFWTQNNVRQAVVRGLHASATARFPDVVLRPMILIIFLHLFIPRSNSGDTAAIAFLLHSLAAMFVMFVGRSLLMRLIPHSANDELVSDFSFATDEKALARSASKIIMLALVVQAASFELEKILLAIFSNPQEVALYAFASRFALMITFVSETVNAALLPKIAQFRNEQKTGELWKTYHRATLINVVGALIILSLVVIFAPYLVEYVSSGKNPQQSFLSAVPLLTLLSVVQVGVQALGPAPYSLLMVGVERKVFNIQIIAFVVQLLSGLILVSSFGAYGAVYSQAIALFVRGWLARIMLYKISK